MTTTTQPTRAKTTATKGVPMDSLRKTALVAGLLYVITFVSIPTLVLYGPVLSDPNYIVGPGPDTPVIIGGILEVIVALAGVGTAVVLYPVVKRQNEAAALGFVGSRTLEGAAIVAGVVSLLSLVTLRQSGAGAGALPTGQALAASYNWFFLLGQSLMPVVNALLLGLVALSVPPGTPNSSCGGIHRSGPAARLRHRGVVRPVGPDICSVRTPCHPDRALGVLAGRLPDREGFQALPNHRAHDRFKHPVRLTSDAT